MAGTARAIVQGKLERDSFFQNKSMFFFAKYVMRIDSLNLLVLTRSLAYRLINTRTDLKQILFSGLMW